ncbi:MAG: uracil-DNA glycosylase [Acidobacteriota bacterium]|nr:uracil-DNA glycosylase [Acidobacteriota bacterium]
MSPSRGNRPLVLSAVRTAIISCNRCPRLRDYCQEVGRVKRAAYRQDVYWARPVPGFGDPDARVLFLGLAPAAHGANRTGRVFTGDGTGGSGDFLMAALKRAGFANRGTSQRPDDGLELRDAYIAAAVRCAPPANKPLPEEVDRCLVHLVNEVAALPRLQIVVALGRIAWDAWLKLLASQGVALPRPRPVFSHGAVAHLGTLAPWYPGTLIGMYHPSRQNTNTGTVTPAMYDAVLRKVAGALRA